MPFFVQKYTSRRWKIFFSGICTHQAFFDQHEMQKKWPLRGYQDREWPYQGESGGLTVSEWEMAQRVHPTLPCMGILGSTSKDRFLIESGHTPTHKCAPGSMVFVSKKKGNNRYL
jgi:hypothetical protein